MRRRRALCAGLAALWLIGAAPGQEARTDEVRPGDTLSDIALRNFGDASLWPAIYLANRDRIKDPARVYPGQRLAIPDLPPDRRAAVREEARSLQSE